MTRVTRTTRRGLTLIETIAAIVVLSISVPSILFAVREAQDQQVDPILISRARWLASEKLEDVIADRHSTARGYAWLINGNYPAEAQVTGFEQFSRSVAIAETAADLASPGSGYKTVTVTIGWTDTNGVARTMTLATVLTEYTAS